MAQATQFRREHALGHAREALPLEDVLHAIVKRGAVAARWCRLGLCRPVQ